MEWSYFWLVVTMFGVGFACGWYFRGDDNGAHHG